MRVLVDSKTPLGVRELASRAEVDPSYVSRLPALLDREALIDRGAPGRIGKVDWQRLLRRWAQDAPRIARKAANLPGTPRPCCFSDSFEDSLDQRYAITGTLAAAKFTSIAPPRLAMVYVENMERALKALDLRPAESGANVLLIEPVPDAVVFIGARAEAGLS